VWDDNGITIGGIKYDRSNKTIELRGKNINGI
jgi:hypothetical protein